MATRPARDIVRPRPEDEHDLTLVGLLVFLDAPKADAAGALRRLAGLGVTVKVVTGDSPAAAVKVCRDLGLTGGGALTGVEFDKLDDAQLAAAIGATTVFARVSPEQKARIVRIQRRTGGDVAFLGDGVNDAQPRAKSRTLTEDELRLTTQERGRCTPAAQAAFRSGRSGGTFGPVTGARAMMRCT